jgi:anaerobic selenocysteine-containing dehydrogenase
MAESRDSISDIWGPRTPTIGGTWPVRVDERTLETPERWVQSACVLCSNGCGMDIGVKDGRIVGVRGRATDRINHGRLGPKGLHGWEANHSQQRLTQPLIRRDGSLQPASWEEAWDLLVRTSKEIKREHGGEAFGIYNTGQLFLEEYYTLSIIGDAGIGTSHVDGNTRLCTATAAHALIESFGTDGDPGSYTDIDVTDALMIFGQNPAATQTVQWMRILDRLHSPNRPKLIVVDPRRTMTAREADVHLAPRAGTNLPLLNGLQHLLIANGHIDRTWIDAHTVGFESLRKVVDRWPPQRVEQVTGVPASQLQEAAAILGTTPSLVSTVLQGVYQSNQATASAVQVNNIQLLRGLIGRPGSTVFQMNGQPTAQNTRETGANGELVAFRNWNNWAHIEDLARIWNVDPNLIPHWAPPTHAMQIFRYAELGSIRWLWIIATNPAVSLPELRRIRDILRKRGLFVVVSDAFLTETAECADLVLPTAIWGEKTGTFTNADRTVHISHQAIDPPGEARSDFNIFVEYARRMEFKDKDGAPLIKWCEPEAAFDAFKEVTRGRPCDYTGLSYAKLSGGSGIQWPCNENYPHGKERLYEDAVFNTDADFCETYGHDLVTGAPVTSEEYRAKNPAGRAVLKAADYTPPHEEPDGEYPLWLTTGRLVYHFHTRTKTGQSAALREAAPEPYVQISQHDAERLGITDGDVTEVTSRRGSVCAPARVGDIEPGHVFLPFHYGYWDLADDSEHHRAANELTMTAWDPVSKQPHFKYTAVQVRKKDAGRGS